MGKKFAHANVYKVASACLTVHQLLPPGGAPTCLKHKVW